MGGNRDYGCPGPLAPLQREECQEQQQTNKQHWKELKAESTRSCSFQVIQCPLWYKVPRKWETVEDGSVMIWVLESRCRCEARLQLHDGVMLLSLQKRLALFEHNWCIRFFFQICLFVSLKSGLKQSSLLSHSFCGPGIWVWYSWTYGLG